MDGDEGGRWVEDPILPELPAPPIDRVAVRGAQLIRVMNVDAPNPGSRRGYTEAVALAWAPLPDGEWAALLAWSGAWRQESGHTTGKARFGWCRILQDRVRAVEKPPRPLGAMWHGHHGTSELGKAVRLAAAGLPPHLWRAALTPRK